MSDIPFDELPTPPRGVRQLPLPMELVGVAAQRRPPSQPRSPAPEVPPDRRDNWSATLGPVDRVSFFEEQRRNRRATWRTSLACTVAVLMAGIPLSLVAAPILYPMLLVVAKLVTFVVPIQGRIVRLVESDLGRALIRIDGFIDARSPGVPVADLLLLGSLAVVPGILAMFWSCGWPCESSSLARESVRSCWAWAPARHGRATWRSSNS